MRRHHICCLAASAPEAGLEQLSLARQACNVPEGIDDAPIFAVIAALLDEYLPNPATLENRLPMGLLMLAMCAANTPDVAVPAP